MKVTTANFMKMAPGQISVSLQKLPNNTPGITEESETLCVLATKVVLPMMIVDAWTSQNYYTAKDIISQAVGLYLDALANQVDQFIAWGDLMRLPLGGDANVGLGEFTGMFNGATALASGDGGDNNMNAAGDFISTFVNYKRAIKDAGFEGAPEGKFFIFSDLQTEMASERGNHMYTGTGFQTERQAVMARDDVADWIASTNFSSSTTTNYHMLVGTPYANDGTPTVRLLQGYNMKVIPLLGGNLNEEGNFVIAVVWSGALKRQTIHATAWQYNSTTHTF